MSETPPENEPDPEDKEPLRRRLPLILAIVASVLGLVIVCVAAIFLIRDARPSFLFGDVTPTPFAPIGQDGNQAQIGIAISNSPAMSLTLSTPTLLAVGDKVYNVVPQAVETTGRWSVGDLDNDQAVWVQGTVVNYLLGINNANANRRVLESLAPGDQIRLTMRDESVFVFVVTAREIVPQTQTDILAQQSPGITIALLGSDNQDRLVVHGDFQTTEGSANSNLNGSGNVVEMGETAQLGSARLTVNSVTGLFDRPEAPPGFIFFLVNFQIQNAGSAPLDTSTLRFELQDEYGNTYAQNPVASQLGNFPPLQGLLNLGEVRDAVSGYQLPAGLTSPTLRWVASTNDVTAGQAQVNIPFAAGGSEASQAALIVPQSAEVSLDGTSVTVVGQITNTGTQNVVVKEGDVSLTSEGTLYLKLSTNPSFPWVIPAGQTITFSVAFQRPLASEAIFTVLGQPFQLVGMR